MKDRLKYIRKYFMLSQEEFGKKINIKSRSHISSLEKGTKNITDRIISDVCREFNINENWLRTGKGDMFSDTNDLIKLINGSNDLKKEIIYKILKLDDDSLKALQKLF